MHRGNGPPCALRPGNDVAVPLSVPVVFRERRQTGALKENENESFVFVLFSGRKGRGGVFSHPFGRGKCRGLSELCSSALQ